jgi:hypothetical protein
MNRFKSFFASSSFVIALTTALVLVAIPLFSPKAVAQSSNEGFISFFEKDKTLTHRNDHAWIPTVIEEKASTLTSEATAFAYTLPAVTGAVCEKIARNLVEKKQSSNTTTLRVTCVNIVNGGIFTITN